MSEAIKAAAAKIVDAAGQAGGIDEVRRLAERGWPETRALEAFGLADSAELRAAVIDAAKRALADG